LRLYRSNKVVKIPSIKRPLAGFRRDCFLLYFDNPGENQAYSPLELKRGILQAFPGLRKITNWEKEPGEGVFGFRVMTFGFQVSVLRS
jgi:hypothetical protein